jgi:DNA-3-methyladenine glycosylase
VPDPDARELLSGAPIDVAPALLGSVLRSTSAAGEVAVRLTEVEAYDGSNDPGSHAYRGRTARNEVMFGEPGHAYVYFTYGMHHCMNVVCRPAGVAGAVLLRAAEVVSGVDLARSRRPTARRDRDLARGPANLVRALGVDRSCAGADLLVAGSMLQLELAAGPPDELVRTGPRVGLRAAPERPWRFWLAGDQTVSAYRPAASRVRRTS